MLKIQYLDTEIRISDVAIIWIVVDKEKNAAFTVVMGRLVIKGDAVPAAIDFLYAAARHRAEFYT